MDEDQFKQLCAFADNVEVSGEITETGTDGFAHYIYAHVGGIEYRVTIEPCWDVAANKPIQRDDGEALRRVAAVARA